MSVDKFRMDKSQKKFCGGRVEEEGGGEGGHTGKRALTVCFPQVRHQSISMMIVVVFKMLWKVSSPLCTTRRMGRYGGGK